MRTVKIKGMSCQHCVKSVKKALEEIDEVVDVAVDLEKGEAVFDETSPVDMAVIEAKVRMANRNARAVRMLREVAGNARSIGAMVSGGGSQAACKRALITALEVCAAHFSLH